MITLLVTVYGANGVGFTPKQMAFPTSQIVLRQITPAESYSGAECNTAIQLLPTGLNVNSPQYYVTDGIDDLTDLING
tara:strand:- start:995 stop:1228 length:234 start_codon:yes stop_codon:yes gene_type:complete